MKIAAIVVEYNPFHNGHQYQIDQIRRVYGYDYIIVIMSGDFTQRGIPAIEDKYVRSRMALSGGADLVLELPVCYATGSAEFFATGALSILNGLGCVDALFFGSESGRLELLQKAAAVLVNETPEFKKALTLSLQTGNSFARARLDALASTEQFTAEEINELSMPNDILGLEYCKAILRLNSTIIPIAIRRIGTGYHDTHTSGNIASADAIRNMIFTETDTISSVVPAQAYQLLSEADTGYRYMKLDDFSSLLHYRLLLDEQRLEEYQDCTADIANRIRQNLVSFENATAFLQLIKTKELTYTRLNRILIHILLDIRKTDMTSYTENEFLGYARILGFSERSKGTLLSAVKQNATIPLITKPADFLPDSDALKKLFKTDILASHIYQSLQCRKSGATFVHELKHSPIICSA